ncbi:MAG: UDP-2,3-diacylglucosamine hydrolase [Candidatus Marinimicrobia bacterium]|nr:UDP-2,3-diacylglucosamine hydrolase [Candidatus Neomarinimicrobiota bacterium]
MFIPAQASHRRTNKNVLSLISIQSCHTLIIENRNPLRNCFVTGTVLTLAVYMLTLTRNTPQNPLPFTIPSCNFAPFKGKRFMVQPLYFISDLHFHVDPTPQDAEKLRRFRALSRRIIADEGVLYIVGDLYDFWFEYKYAIPRHHLGVLWIISELAEAGTEIHYLTGNHDYWIGEFWEKDMGVHIHQAPIETSYADKRFWICHGDGVLADDRGYRILKKILRNPVAIRLFRLLHPDWAFRLAKKVSSTSRKYNKFDIDQNRQLLTRVYEEYVLDVFQQGYDYVVMGHLHHPHLHTNENQTFINLGDWLNFYTFGVFDGAEFTLNYLTENLERRIRRKSW